MTTNDFGVSHCIAAGKHVPYKGHDEARCSVGKGTVTITIPVEIKVSDLLDVLTTAYEQGISYWVQHAEETVRDGDLNVLTTRIFWEPNSDTDRGCATLDPHLVGVGVGRILTGQVQIRDDLRAQVATLLTDDPDIDADAADCIVQAGIFGELVYG